MALTLVAFGAQAQQNVTVTGVLTDGDSRQKLEGASVQLVGSERGTITDENGSYSISVNTNQKVQLRFQFIGYSPRTITLDGAKIAEAPTTGYVLNVKLYFQSTILDTFVISGKPIEVFGSELISVEDFEFWDEDRLILLTYEKTLKKGSKVVLTDQDQTILSTHYVPKEAESLYRDYEGNINLMCKGAVYLVELEHGELILTKRDPQHFSKEVVPIIDTVENKVYLSNYHTDYPAFDYYTWARGDSVPDHLTFIVDDWLMEIYRSEFKYLPPRQKLEAVRLGMEFDIDKEVAAAILSGFSKSKYYEPLYAPLFLIDDTAYIFDHHKDVRYRFNGDNEVLDTVAIAYHKTKPARIWQREMLQDKEEGRIYGLFEKNGYYYLKTVNPITGKVEQTFKFTWKYTERVQVRDGYVYYIYRPFESAQKKFLYRELIRPNY